MKSRSKRLPLLLLGGGLLLVAGVVLLGLRGDAPPRKAAAPAPPPPAPSAPAPGARESDRPAPVIDQDSLVQPGVKGDQIEVIPPGDEVWSDIGEYDREAFADDPGLDQHKIKLLDALDLKPGMIVADIGAGGGRLAWPLARELGPKGLVLAIDINPLALEIMRARVKKEPLPHNNLRIIHSHPWNVGISPTPHQTKVDRACLIEAHFFKHFPNKKETLSCLRSIFLAMRPGAKLVVQEHKSDALKAVTNPLVRAGFVLERRLDREDKKIDPSFLLTFRRP